MTHYSSFEQNTIQAATTDHIRAVLTELGWVLSEEELPPWLKGKAAQLWRKKNTLRGRLTCRKSGRRLKPGSCIVVEPVHPDWLHRRYEMVRDVVMTSAPTSFACC